MLNIFLGFWLGRHSIGPVLDIHLEKGKGHFSHF